MKNIDIFASAHRHCVDALGTPDRSFGDLRGFNFKHFGFTLAEMMVVMLILSIIMAAMAPVMTTRNKLDQSSPWSWATNGSDAYYGLGDAQVAMIGQEEVKSTDDASRLIINAGDGKNHILFKNSGTSLGSLRFENNGLLLGSLASGSLVENSVAIGRNTSVAQDNSTVVGVNASATNSNATAIGFGSTASGYASIAIGGIPAATGSSAQATADGAIAIGSGASTSYTAGIALGHNAISRANSSIAIGTGANTQSDATDSIAIGHSAITNGYGIAIGGGETLSNSYSVSIGNDSEASGNYSIALGSGATANNLTSMALGYNSKASGQNSAAVGYDTEASGTGSTALGYNSTASHTYSVAVGYGSIASSADSIAIGYNSEASNIYSTSLGYNTESSGGGSLALGPNAKARGSNSIAIGGNTSYLGDSAISTGSNSIAIGSGARAESNNSIAIGTSACSNASGKSGSKQICIGSSGAYNSEADEVIYIGGAPTLKDQANLTGGTAPLEIYNDRNHGSAVVVNGTLVVRGYVVSLAGNYSDTRLVSSYLDGGGAGAHWKILKWVAGNSPYSNDAAGNPGYLSGNVVSDRRLKYVGKENTSGLEKIKQLKVFNYTFKKDEKKIPHVGVIAQDLRKVFPDAVKKGVDGFLTIRFEDMFFAMINAIKELDEKYQAQEKRINELEARIEKLEAKIK